MNRWLKAVILIYLTLLFFGSFLVVGLLWTSALEKWLPYIAKIKIFLYYFFAGSIGGSLRYLYMFCYHYMEDKLTDYKVWIMYVCYPVFASGTAAVAISLIQSGMFSLVFTDSKDAPYAQLSIAFFVGFGFNRFINKLNEVSKELFRTDHKN